MPIVTGPVREFIIMDTVKPENKPCVGKTIAQLGEMTGKHPIDALVDLMVDEELQTTIFTPPFNTDEDLNAELMQSEYTVPGVSDGGAHTKFVTIGRYTTDFIADFCREHQTVSLEEAHYRLSALPAKMAGFRDRGMLQEGRPADIVVYDLESLGSTPPEVSFDFPAGEWRRIQKAEGYRWIFVNGEATFIDGECTNKTPGRLLRHGTA